MKALELEGTRYGLLTVTKRIGGSRDGSVLWECVCDCGNVAQVTSRHLNRKKNVIRSCGCLKKISGAQHKDWKGVGDISGHWWASHIGKSSSKRAELTIQITKEYAWNLYLQQNKRCALTGLLLFISTGNGNTASIDRIDSSRGYVEGNIQWVHKDINYMKRNYSTEYFTLMCKLVVNNQEGNGYA